MNVWRGGKKTTQTSGFRGKLTTSLQMTGEDTGQCVCCGDSEGKRGGQWRKTRGEIKNAEGNLIESELVEENFLFERKIVTFPCFSIIKYIKTRRMIPQHQ